MTKVLLCWSFTGTSSPQGLPELLVPGMAASPLKVPTHRTASVLFLESLNVNGFLKS